MKRLVVAVACAGVVACVFAARAALAAGKIEPADVRPNLFDACFISDTEGWVIGDLADNTRRALFGK